MNSITNNTAHTAFIALTVFALFAVGVAAAPKVHAADLGIPDTGGSWQPVSDTSYYPDTSSYDTSSYDTSGYWQPVSDTPVYDYGSGSDFGSGCSSCGGFGGFSGGGFSNPGFGFGGGSSSTFAPTTVSNNVPTTIYSPSNTNICTGGNVCNSSTDDHSIFNAPTTVTISNPTPAQTQTQVVYQQVPVYQQPNYPVYNTPCYSCQQPSYPVYNNPCYTCQQPVVYPTPVRQPYVSLSAAPYTGLDLGPVGTVAYWSFLVFWCLLAAYLIVYKRVQTKVVSGLNHFLFGPKVGTHAKVVMPAASHSTHAAPKAYVAPVAKNDDAIDPFIASQIARNK
ncbi:MAG TPA: hypothetical protein VIY48_02320 [Candidatus Paceibacterota bacterium]